MGLTSGPHGVKTLVKGVCANSIRDFESLAHVAEAAGCPPKQAVVIMDGNVLTRLIPTKITSFSEYASAFERFVYKALNAADTVIVVFDDPEKTTLAKVEEQMRRDLNAKKREVVCSADLSAMIPKTDDYTLEQMQRLNPHDLISHRKARARLFDGVCKRTMVGLSSRLQSQEKSLIFDGIDNRGADRPVGERRSAGFYSNDAKLEKLMERPHNASLNGEGDVKLTELECEIRYLRNEGIAFDDVNLVLISTIDTDSIAIELMAQSARNRETTERPELPDPITTVLCIREKSAKRAEPGGEESKTWYSCIDVESAHAQLCKAIAAPKGLERNAIALLCGGWILCKSDFVEMKGLRPDAVLMATRQICESEKARTILNRMKYAWTTELTATFEQRARARSQIGKCLVSLCGRAEVILHNMPRMKKASASVKDALELEQSVNPSSGVVCADENDLISTPSMLFSRAAFVLVYWNGTQLCNSQMGEWGFSLAHAASNRITQGGPVARLPFSPEESLPQTDLARPLE